MAILLSIATFFSTVFGGLFALKFKDKLHLVMAFSAGAVIAAALFDLLPESIEVGIKQYRAITITTCVALGFFVYLLLDKMAILHSSDRNKKRNMVRGQLGAGTFSVHSFFDGVAIGFGFQVSNALGLIMAIAVLTHDFSDGINTVVVMLRENASRKEAFKWLLIDGITPLIGAVSTLFYKFPGTIIGLVLAIFSGCFLYIGASDLLPESQDNSNIKLTTLLTISGALLLSIIIKILG
jgi:ZIP family zinc transporter